MAVLGRLLIASAERLDLPDLLSIDSFAAGDFKYLMKALMGDDTPYVLKGFDVISPQDAIGSQNISIRVADSVVFYPGSNAGPFYHGLEEGNENAQPLVPELRKNATNYVYCTLTTFETSRDTRAFWDPDLDGGDGGEFTQDVNTESVLSVDVNVSTSSFPDNTIPIAIVTVGAAVIESIEDARPLMFRLGSGGLDPDPFSTYNFPDLPSSTYSRKEPPTTMSSALDPNPFQGADKNIGSLKEWMDAVMTKLAELGGTTFWYEDASTFSLINLFLDSVGTSFRSKGNWDHNSSTPGLLTWSEDINIKNIVDPRETIIRQGNKTLADDEVMYIEMVREEPINTGNVAVEWFNGLNFVNGQIGAFQNLTKGDWVKKSSDSNELYLRVEEFYANDSLTGGVTSPALAESIKLSSTYAGVNETERGLYSKGVYLDSEVSIASRGSSSISDLGGNVLWLATRQDTVQDVSDITTTALSAIDITEADGTTAKVTATTHGLSDGERVTIADSVVGYNGTYVVEVEDADTFYINTADNGDEIGVANAYYAVATTAARSTDDGLQLESANHNFKSNDTIIVADTSSSFDGSYEIAVRSNTTFQFAVGSNISNVSTGSATLARINVRSEFGVVTIVQGESTGIASDDADTIRQFIGMGSASETNPSYNIPLSYNTLDGQQNYNGETDDNLTVRVSKLTAMMADKTQDKTIKLLPSGYDSVNNNTNGAVQEISFNASPSATPTLYVAMPSSANNGSVTLSGILSLEANQAAYITVDRNASFTVASLAAVSVADIEDVPLEENTFILAIRLSGDDVWLWDGFYVSSGATTPVPGYLETVAIQNLNAKLVRGGTWSWDDGTDSLTWDADAYIQVGGLTEARNTISAQTINLTADGEVAYVSINRDTGIADTLAVTVADIASVPTDIDVVIFARRIGNNVLIGENSDILVDGEDQTLIGNDTWKLPVADFASLPATGNVDGDVRLVLDTRVAYHWDDTATEWLPLTGTGAGLKLIGGGTVAWNSTDGFLYDQTTTTNSLDATSANTWVSTSFTPSSNYSLSQVTSRIGRSGSPTGTIRVDIVADDGGGEPDETTILGSSNTIDVSTLGGGTGNIETFTFTPIALTSGVTYHAIIRWDTATFVDVTNYWVANYQSGNPIATSDSFSTTDAGATWSPLPVTGDLNMTVGQAAADELTFTADMYLEKIGLAYTDNTIPTSESPIELPNDKDVAYVIPNLQTGGGNLSVTVDTLDNVPLTAVVIARRDGNDVIVGSSSTRLADGESTSLYNGITFEEEDKLYGLKTAFWRSDNPVTWTGADLQFTDDLVLEALNHAGDEQTYTVDVGDSPIALTDGQYAYATIDRNTNSETISITVGAAPGESAPGTEVVILGVRRDAGGAGYLHLPLHKQVLEPGQTVRLGASGAGGGGGNSFIETLKNRLNDSIFEAVTPYIASEDQDDATLIDSGLSTGEYSLVDSRFKLTNIGDTLVSENLLDATFLADSKGIQKAELVLKWDEDGLDTGATYELSRNGGNEWQTVTMERVDDSYTYRGIHEFDAEAADQTISEEATTNATQDLDDANAQYIAHEVTLANLSVLRNIDLDVNVAGSPVGYLELLVVSDDTSLPSTDPNDIQFISSPINISGLATGTLSVDLGELVLGAGTYHFVLRPNQTYTDEYTNSSGSNSISFDVNVGGSGLGIFNGTVWANPGSAASVKHVIEGIELDLRLRVTSSVTDALIEGFGAFYEQNLGNLAIATTVEGITKVSFQAVADNTNSFTLPFLPNAELLIVHLLGSGQSFRFGDFSLQGNTIVFPEDQFNNGGIEKTQTLIFDQLRGGAFDNSDVNASLLAANGLGSTDGSLDKSSAGVGIKLRSPDGTLWHITVEDDGSMLTTELT